MEEKEDFEKYMHSQLDDKHDTMFNDIFNLDK